MKLAKTLGAVCCAVLMLEAAEWSAPVEVQHELKPVLTYRARVDGDLLVIEAALQPGWKTFTIDNVQRAAEKLAGKPSLGIDQPTRIKPGAGIELAGPWHQLPPKDFSKPALRWFSWGYENQALFAAKIRRSGSGDSQIGIRGQTCTETTCKNIDVTVAVPASSGETTSSVDLKGLVPVRAAD
jgi:hypothetical protein